MYRKQTTPVGSIPANAFGLHDMLGNIWEWCEDIYSDQAYSKHQRSNPIYMGTDYASGTLRVLRGGSWGNFKHSLWSANRHGRDAAYRNFRVGFRLARTA